MPNICLLCLCFHVFVAQSRCYLLVDLSSQLSPPPGSLPWLTLFWYIHTHRASSGPGKYDFSWHFVDHTLSAVLTPITSHHPRT